MSGAELVLGVDSSTTACKVLAFDRDGAVVAEGRASIPLENPREGAWEQRPEQIWSAFVDAARACLGVLDAARVRGLAIAHQRETFVVTDEHGEPQASALTWMDHRCRGAVDGAVAALGADRLHRISGKPPCTTPSLYKWLGQREREPDLARRVTRLEDVHAFLVRRLTGASVTSLAAADPLGLVDMQARAWSDELVALAHLEIAKLPRLVEVGAELGRISADAAAVSGLPAGLPVLAGAGDGQAAGLGAGITGPGRAYLNLGTAVVSGVLAREYRYDRAYRTLFGTTPGSYFLETDLQGGTFTVNWLCERLLGRTLDVLPELERAAAALVAGSNGLTLVPYWNGVMNPFWDDFASGIVVGLTGSHGPAHLYRALLEGIAFEQRLHSSGVEADVGPIAEFVAMGGGSSSALFCQILADVLARPLVRSATREATALGAAMIAAVGSGLHGSFEDAAQAMCRDGERFVPGPDATRYAELYERRYKLVYPALRPILAATST